MEIPIVLRVFVAIVSVAFTCYSIALIAARRLQLQYALLWFVLAIVAFLSALFPAPLFALSHFIGFEHPSNFVFFAGFSFTLLILMSLTVVLSQHSRQLASLTQENALLRIRIERLEQQLLSDDDCDGDAGA